MNQRTRLRQLRKQALLLQIRRHRLAMRTELAALRAPFISEEGRSTASGQWLEILGSLSGVILSARKGRWGRALSIGLLSWKLIKRILANPGSASPDRP